MVNLLALFPIQVIRGIVWWMWQCHWETWLSHLSLMLHVMDQDCRVIPSQYPIPPKRNPSVGLTLVKVGIPCWSSWLYIFDTRSNKLLGTRCVSYHIYIYSLLYIIFWFSLGSLPVSLSSQRRYARKLPVLLQRMLPRARDAPWGRRRDQLRMMQFPLRHRLRVVNRRCHGKRPRQKRQKLKEVRIKVQLHPRSPGHQRQQSHQHEQQCRQRLKFPKQILPEQKQNPRGQKLLGRDVAASMSVS